MQWEEAIVRLQRENAELKRYIPKIRYLKPCIRKRKVKPQIISSIALSAACERSWSRILGIQSTFTRSEE